MSAAMPFTARQQYPAASTLRLPPPGQGLRRRLLMHPLTAICAVQAALSLSLVWSNTAFADEAQYLGSGQLEWAHWLHGAYVPPYLLSSFSGSPVIYPPVGALANSIGGLAGARICHCYSCLARQSCFISRRRDCSDRTAAVIAAALWALSEPAIRLAFATFDPLSVLLTALSAWLIVQAGHRSPSRCVRGRSGGRPCSRQRNGILGDHHRPCSDHLRIPRVVALHAIGGRHHCAQFGSPEDIGGSLWSADDHLIVLGLESCSPSSAAAVLTTRASCSSLTTAGDTRG